MKRILISVGFLLSLLSTLVAKPIEPGNWDRVRLYGHGNNNWRFSEEEYQFIKDNYWMVTIEKTHGQSFYGKGQTDIGSIDAAARIKADNPNAQILYYWNVSKTWSELYASVTDILTIHPDWEINDIAWDWDVGGDALSDWWVATAVDMVDSSDHNGVFLDAGGGNSDEISRVSSAVNGIVLYNGIWMAGNGVIIGTENMEVSDGYYCESFFCHKVDTSERAITYMDALLEQPKDKYAICVGNVNTLLNTDPTFSLACYLIVAHDKSFFKWQAGAVPGRFIWWLDEYGYALGEPYGPAVKQNNIYTRSFEFCDVMVDLNTLTHSLSWHSGNPDGANLALNKSTSQSSTNHDGVPARAVDGNTSGEWSDGSVSHTVEEANAWWEVDLGVSESISEVKIFNRSILRSRLSDFTVSLIDRSGSVTYSQSFSDYPDPSIALDIGGAVGSVVRVQLNGTGILSLAEVEVYGLSNESPSFNTDSIIGGVATESVAYRDSISGLAVDPEVDELSYTILSGPTWLSVTPSGELSGAPQASNVGVNSWSIKVSDEKGGADIASLHITVELAHGLVAYWPLDDASGAVTSDLSVHGHDGTVNGGNWVTGIHGGALDFDGSDTLVSLPASAFTSVSDQISISMWVCGDTTQPRNDSVFYATDASGDKVLNIHLPWSNSIVYWDAGDSGNDRISKAASPSEFMGAWNHWVFTKNATAGEMKIYLNGSLWHAASGTVKTMSGITAAVLGGQVSGSIYDGKIDEVRLYDQALDDQEVATLFQSYRMKGIPVDWLSTYGLAISESVATENPDGDALVNFAEYALGGVPTDATNTGHPTAIEIYEEGAIDWFEFVYSRRIGFEGELHYSIEVSTDMASDSWMKGTYEEVSVTETSGDDFESVTNRIDITGKAHAFIRLNVESIE